MDNNDVLAAVATGLIAPVILASRQKQNGASPFCNGPGMAKFPAHPRKADPGAMRVHWKGRALITTWVCPSFAFSLGP